jgi:hypothetical protein
MMFLLGSSRTGGGALDLTRNFDGFYFKPEDLYPVIEGPKYDSKALIDLSGVHVFTHEHLDFSDTNDVFILFHATIQGARVFGELDLDDDLSFIKYDLTNTPNGNKEELSKVINEVPSKDIEELLDSQTAEIHIPSVLRQQFLHTVKNALKS